MVRVVLSDSPSETLLRSPPNVEDFSPNTGFFHEILRSAGTVHHPIMTASFPLVL